MDWGELEKIRRSPDPGCWCFLAIIRVYFIASAIRLRNCLVPSHAQEWSFGAVPPREWTARGLMRFGMPPQSDGTRGVCFLFWGDSFTRSGAAARGVLIFLSLKDFFKRIPASKTDNYYGLPQEFDMLGKIL